MEYIVGCLNYSLLVVPVVQMKWLRYPGIAWSEMDLWMERVTMAQHILQLQIYPIRSDNKSKTSLKFITSDGIKYNIPSLSMFMQPLDTALWLTAIGFLVFVMLIIALVRKIGEGRSLANSLRWTVFWLYGAMVDQVLDVPRAKENLKTVIERILFLVLVLIFLVNNLYKAEFNV